MKNALHDSSWFQQSETNGNKQSRRRRRSFVGFIHEKQTQEKGIKGEKNLHFNGIVGNKTHFTSSTTKKLRAQTSFVPDSQCEYLLLSKHSNRNWKKKHLDSMTWKKKMKTETWEINWTNLDNFVFNQHNIGNSAKLQ